MSLMLNNVLNFDLVVIRPLVILLFSCYLCKQFFEIHCCFSLSPKVILHCLNNPKVYFSENLQDSFSGMAALTSF